MVSDRYITEISDSLVQVHRHKKLSIVALDYPFRTKPSRPRSSILELCFAPLLDRFGSVSTLIRNFLILVHCRPPSKGVDNFRPQYQVAPNSRIIISTWIQNLFFIISCTWVLSKSIAIWFSACEVIFPGVLCAFTVNFWVPHFLARTSWVILIHTNNFDRQVMGPQHYWELLRLHIAL